MRASLRRFHKLSFNEQQDWLKGALRASPLEAVLLVCAILDAGTEWDRENLLELLHKEDCVVLARLAARQLLGDPWDMARWEAADVLADVGTRQDVPRLITALQDRDPAIRSSAAIALGRIGGARAFRELSAALATDRSDIVRRDAASALADGRWKSSEIEQVLRTALTREKEPLARVGLTAALYYTDETANLGDLLRLLDDEDSLVRTNVVNSIEPKRVRKGDLGTLFVAIRRLVEADPHTGVQGDAAALLASLNEEAQPRAEGP